MFSRRRSIFEYSRNRLGKAPRRKKQRRSQQLSNLSGGNRSLLSVEHLEARHMLTTPTVVSVTPSDSLITDGDVGASSFSIAVQFSEAMTADGSSDPTLVFDPNVASTLSFASDSWSADMLTYTAVFNVADAGVDIPGVDVNVSGGRDAAGDLQAASDAFDIFDINTQADVLSITPNDLLITDADVGAGNFTVTVVYDEPMVSDGSQDPTVTFNPIVASTLTFASGSWSAGDTTYTATYDVADANTEVNNIDIAVSGGEDLAGNAPANATEADAFSIDTENPTVLSVTPSDPVISDADVGNDAFSIDVVFSEDMTTDGSADPTLAFNPAVATTLTLDAAASSWLNSTTYRAVYDVADAGATVPGVDVNVSGARDDVGNLQTVSANADVFDIDTDNPSVISITPSDTVVTDADVGSPFTVAVVYDEAMTADGSANPTITFDPAVASTLTFVSGAWSAGDTTYTATYSVADAGVTVNGIDITASGAQDAAGNLQVNATEADQFIIDTENPTVVSVTPSDLLISDIDVANPFTIAVLFSEPMTDDGSADPTITFDPDVASTLSLASGSWSADGRTFTATYDVSDANVEVFDIGVMVDDGLDANGNLQVPANFADVFEIDTLELTVAGSAPYLIFNDFETINVGDIDFFQYTAHHTGKLIINSFFDHINGDLDLEVRDLADNLIVSSTSTTDNEEVVLPVVTQETYLIRVLGKAPADINQYDLEIENFAAPAPAFVDLVSSSDTGFSNTDNVTSDDTPTFLVQADLVDFRDMGITLLNQATIDPNNDGDAADATDDGAGVFVTLVNLDDGSVTEGFADQVGVSGFLWTFTPNAALTPGEYFVTSAVQMVDGQQDPNRETGRAQLSDPLFITILDANPVMNMISADLNASSDSGMFDDDNVTNIMALAFQGIAPTGSIVRIYANGLSVGQTVTGSDTSDVGIGAIGGIGGANNDGLGLWEITTEPLTDGAYDITLEVEDAAGTVTTFDVDLDNDVATTIDVVVDKLAPNTPLLDLIDDTGENLADEITSNPMPQFFMTTTDPNIALAETLFTDNLKFRIFDRFENNPEALLYDSAADAAADNVTTAGDMFTSLTALTRAFNLADGTHNLKLEVEDRAGNISEDFLLEVFVDTVDPAAVTPNLLDSSDSGMLNDDNVTNKWEPAFDGVAEINNKVFVYATLIIDSSGNAVVGASPVLVGSGLVGSELSNNVDGDGLGAWEVTVEPMVEGVYDITVRFEDWAGNFTPLDAANANALRIVIDKTAPNTPYLDLITNAGTGDTGRSDVDNITKQNQPIVTMTSEDPNVFLAQALFNDNYKFRIYDRYESFGAPNNEAEFLLYDSTQDAAVDAVNVAADMFTALTLIEERLPDQYFANVGTNNAVLAGGVLADGVHNLKLEVEDRAGNVSHDFLLELIIDTLTPAVSFGLPNAVVNDDGLAADSDSGVTTDPTTFGDRVTSDTTPRLWGRAEANTVVRVYNDNDGDGIIDLATDTFLGQTVAVPFDGNDAFVDDNGDPLGYWEVVSALDLNQIVGLPKDGLRRLLVTAEDVAGNPMPMAGEIADGVDTLNIFIDTQGPQVYDPAGVTQAVHPTADPAYDLFDPKPSENGFTPLTDSITINVRDLPLRSNVDPNFVYFALQQEIAETVGNYRLVGDHVGPIGITNVTVLQFAAANQQATATIQLDFADFLPDDRYTLTVSDNLVDPANNKLDGESNATGPLENPTFPSGDGVPGGDFVGRFTIDSVPEIGSYVSQNIDIDINGNFVWDPSNGQIGNDATNVDITFTMDAFLNGAAISGNQSPHDLLTIGRFTPIGTNMPGQRFFDQFANYGNYNGIFQWLIDFDSDGVVYGNGDPDGVDDLIVTQAPIAGFANIAGALPIAGNFDNNADNGDEIGLYYAGQWALDTNHDYIIDTVVNTNLYGTPIVGDFDGDGIDDAGVFNNNLFTFDLAVNGFNGADANIVWGFPGVLDRPVAADMDQDGIDDIGLWVPRNSAQDNRPIAEWYFLISNDENPNDGFNDRVFGSVNTLNHPFTPVPFGADLYAEFGDELALPIVGNFDPPVVAGDLIDPNTSGTGDFDQDGDVDGTDFLAYQRGYSMSGAPSMADGDGNSDGVVDSLDLDLWASAYQSSSNATIPGDNRRFSNGIEFLAWQRNASASPVAAALAPESDLAAFAGIYRPAYEPPAREAAFEALENASEEYFVDPVSQSSDVGVALASSSATSPDDDGSADRQARELYFSLDDDSQDDLF